MEAYLSIIHPFKNPKPPNFNRTSTRLGKNSTQGVWFLRLCFDDEIRINSKTSFTDHGDGSVWKRRECSTADGGFSQHRRNSRSSSAWAWKFGTSIYEIGMEKEPPRLVMRCWRALSAWHGHKMEHGTIYGHDLMNCFIHCTARAIDFWLAGWLAGWTVGRVLGESVGGCSVCCA
ncbi:hypothetical protein BKA80DRAFT_3152 [Phyllosticta citrichinensis]